MVEAGAGRGTLAAHILAAAPRCSAALRYLLVERSAALRLAQARLLPLEPATTVVGGVAGRRGPLVASLPELPSGPVVGVVLANELLDNLAFSLLERRGGSWFEARVGEGSARVGEGSGSATSESGLAEVMVAAPPDLASEAERLTPDAPEGARIPRQDHAQEWLRQALGLLERGRVVAIDYASTTAGLAGRPWPQWLRTYRGQGRGGHPLDRPGTQDVTCEVCVDQLAQVKAPVADRSQTDFLEAHGLPSLVAEAQATWQERAAVGDLAALVARSRLGEARSLTDPGGLGAFRVMEWLVP